MIMKYYIMVILMALPFLSQAQSKAVNQFFNKYKNEESAIKISVPEWLVKASSNMVHYTPAKDAMQKAKKIKILLLDDGEIIKTRHIRKLERRMERERFKDIISVRHNKLNIQLLGKMINGNSSQLVFKAIGNDSAFLISLEGNFKQTDINEIMNKIKLSSNLNEL